MAGGAPTDALGPDGLHHAVKAGTERTICSWHDLSVLTAIGGDFDIFATVGNCYLCVKRLYDSHGLATL